MTTTDENEATTADEQIRTLRNLRQTAAAWLLGYKSSRSLRDSPDIPRTPSGGYDAAQLLAWARTRQPRPELSDDDVERTLSVVGWTIPDDCRCLLDYLQDLQARHGDAGLLFYCDELLRCLRACSQHEPPISPTPPPPLTRLEENRILAAEHRERVERWHRQRLAVRIVCERCGRVRHGRKWAKAELPDGTPKAKDICPTCDERRTKR